MAEAVSLDRNLALDAVRVTESAARAASRLTGLGERDEAPMLFIGEEIGTKNGPKVDVALDPLEGTTICATGGPNSLAVLAMAEQGGFLNAPDTYMDKIAVGDGLPEDLIDIDDEPAINLARLAKAKKCEIDDLMVLILDRPRHSELIAKVRESRARVQLIQDGDVAGVIATTRLNRSVDIYIGIGGAPEGVLAAAALRCIGGQMMGRLVFRNDDEKKRARKMGIEDLNRKYSLHDLAGGDVMFAATGVTDGAMLKGVHRFAGGAHTHSVVMRSRTGTLRLIEAEHDFNRRPPQD
jgi:fructose-1,6-bisphosphatase II / sedoheptulose-1,7-bisphosphatase